MAALGEGVWAVGEHGGGLGGVVGRRREDYIGDLESRLIVQKHRPERQAGSAEQETRPSALGP